MLLKRRTLLCLRRLRPFTTNNNYKDHVRTGDISRLVKNNVRSTDPNYVSSDSESYRGARRPFASNDTEDEQMDQRIKQSKYH